MSTSKPWLKNGQKIADYCIVRRIGGGGMGEVYEVIDTKLDRRAALKLLPPELSSDQALVARFRREAKAASQMRHPGVVSIFDYGELSELDGTPYFIMEYLEGETLSSRIGRVARQPGGRLGVSCLLLLQQIAHALAAVHQHGLVHRDLKPANVMIVEDPDVPDGERAKLVDFGIVKIVQGIERQPESSIEGDTRNGMILGTPQYMAPEQWRNSRQIDGKTDVYALGVIAFLGLTGRLPFVAHDAPALGMLHCYQPAPNLNTIDPSLPLPLAELVAQMLEKDPARRPSMARVAETLSRIISHHHEGRWPSLTKSLLNLREEDLALAQTIPPSGGRNPNNRASSDERKLAALSEDATDKERCDDSISMEIFPGLPEAPTNHTAQQAERPQDISERSLLVGSRDGVKPGISRGTWISRVAFVALLISVISASTWLWPSRRMMREPDLGPIEPVASASQLVRERERLPAASTPSETTERPLPEATSKSDEKHSCHRTLPSSSCIRTLSMNLDQRMLLLRAFYRSDAKFCAGERLVVTGLPIMPRLAITPKSMSRRVRSALTVELRGLLERSAVPSSIEIRCPAPRTSRTQRD